MVWVSVLRVEWFCLRLELFSILPSDSRLRLRCGSCQVWFFCPAATGSAFGWSRYVAVVALSGARLFLARNGQRGLFRVRLSLWRCEAFCSACFPPRVLFLFFLVFAVGL